ncbi:unnamed protein product, partial [Amoebophrya sp. A25]
VDNVSSNSLTALNASAPSPDSAVLPLSGDGITGTIGGEGGAGTREPGSGQLPIPPNRNPIASSGVGSSTLQSQISDKDSSAGSGPCTPPRPILAVESENRYIKILSQVNQTIEANMATAKFNQNRPNPNFLRTATGGGGGASGGQFSPGTSGGHAGSGSSPSLSAGQQDILPPNANMSGTTSPGAPVMFTIRGNNSDLQGSGDPLTSSNYISGPSGAPADPMSSSPQAVATTVAPLKPAAKAKLNPVLFSDSPVPGSMVHVRSRLVRSMPIAKDDEKEKFYVQSEKQPKNLPVPPGQRWRDHNWLYEAPSDAHHMAKWGEQPGENIIVDGTATTGGGAGASSSDQQMAVLLASRRNIDAGLTFQDIPKDLNPRSPAARSSTRVKGKDIVVRRDGIDSEPFSVEEKQDIEAGEWPFWTGMREYMSFLDKADQPRETFSPAVERGRAEGSFVVPTLEEDEDANDVDVKGDKMVLNGAAFGG